ncbi:hypothetical protein [Paenibacillus puerhi]|uniref:hypothetical protein n=1 Tax=Paenibacillus puerhi TaxID=2692622 RepID=UPI00135989B1|nr:hypothetical protein [Paenibacillus puerhi]
MSKSLTVFLAACVLMLSVLPTADAAITLTATVKTALERTISEADRSQADKLTSLYNEFVQLQSRDAELTSQLKAVNAKNKEAQASLTKQIKQIDAARLDRLEQEVRSSKDRYAPLFAQYTLLNKQLEASRSLGTKELSRILSLQINAMKIPVQLARMNIRAKEAEWKNAKEQASKAAKKVRTVLEGVEPLQAQIKAKQGAVKTIEASMTPVWSSFKQAVQRKEAKSAHSTLASVVSLSSQVNKEKQNLVGLENKISAILASAQAQLP